MVLELVQVLPPTIMDIMHMLGLWWNGRHAEDKQNCPLFDGLTWGLGGFQQAKMD